MPQEPNPFAPPAALDDPKSAGAERDDAAWWASALQMAGILSIVFGICCPLIGIGLGAVTLALGASATAAAHRLAAGDLLDKIATGKTCAVVGLVVGVLNSLVGMGLVVLQALKG
jgi:hypothetical protein